jgi:hypothetical protein
MTCPSEFVLDEVLSHGGPPDVGAHVSGCPSCQQRVADRRADGERFAPFAPQIWRAVEKGAPRRRRRWLPALVAVPAGLAAAFSVVLLLSRSPVNEGSSHGSIYTGPKGGFTLGVPARRGSDVFMTDAVHPARAGDELRFVPSGTSPGRFIAIVSLDGRRQLTLFYPARADEDSPPVPPAGEALPGGIILDDAPGPERLFVVLSAQPLRGAEVQAAVRAQVERGVSAEAALARARANVVEVVVEKTP